MVSWCKRYRMTPEEADCTKNCDGCTSLTDLPDSVYSSYKSITEKHVSLAVEMIKEGGKKRKKPIDSANQPFYGYILIDANIIIHAAGKDFNAIFCQQLLHRLNKGRVLATTNLVLNEICTREDNRRIMDEYRFKIYNVNYISEYVKELTISSETQLSEPDKSLIQAAIDNKNIVAIISYDSGFQKAAAKGIIQKKSDYQRSFRVNTAKEYLNSIVHNNKTTRFCRLCDRPIAEYDSDICYECQCHMKFT
jgi:predicted nucleic acid-binding protein